MMVFFNGKNCRGVDKKSTSDKVMSSRCNIQHDNKERYEKAGFIGGVK